ncbi:hypothetical protein [Subtercola lobariae]|uniref:Alkaline shock response membrane anchor protein AmaP n=1 Tax=Subtercola lobariae TaxID=1588641 RepID=A0A917EV67_9MICO|nr:hypothetical protein [Subtercola lobariae]GGF10209.1 hypothetical protein GCM10011399_00100 [Subtercola lobariae]
MNTTNRGANRLVIIVAGVIVLALGAVAIALALPTVIRAQWRDGSNQATRTIVDWLQQTPLSGPGTSWLWLIGLAALVVLLVLLLVFISRQGKGHTSTLATPPPTENGLTVVDSSVAVGLLNDALADRPEFVSSSVSTYLVKKRPVLKIAVTCRRGVSPHEVATMVSTQLGALDALLGIRIPAFVQISGGFRARVSRATRLQ